MSDLTDDAPAEAGEASPVSDGPDPEAGLPGVAMRPPVQRRRSRRNPRIWLAVGALAIIAIAVWQIVSAVRGGSSTPQYTTTAAEKGTLAVTVDGSGFVYASKNSSVSTKVSGTVSGLHVAVGRTVQEGDVLFYVENEDLDGAVTKALASYRQSKQSVDQAELQLMQAEQQLDQLENPASSATRTSTTPSEQDLDIANERVAGAEQGLSAARANRDAAYETYEKALEDQDSRTVTAPMDGVITALNIANGDAVSAGSGGSSTSSAAASANTASSGTSSSSGTGSSSSGTNSSSAPIVITNMRSLYAQIPVNEVDVSSVKRRQKATMTFDAIPNLTITGRVSRISPAGTNTQGVVTFDVNISFDVQNRRLRPGMSTSASIVTAIAREVLVVPNAAVQTSNGETYVRILDNANGTGTPRNVSVKIGLANDTMTQITSGLKSGEYVVTGQRVTTNSSSGSSGGFRFPGMGGGTRSSSGSSSGSSGGSSSGGNSTGGNSSGGGVARPPGD